MTRHTRNYRPPFLDAPAVRRGEGRRGAYVDAGCDFVALRDLVVEGAPVAAGEVLNKSRVSGRRLRQLYEARSIALAPGSAPVAAPPRPPAIGPTDLLRPGAEGQQPAAAQGPRVPRRVRSRRAA